VLTFYCLLHAEAIAATRRIQAFLLLPESEQQVPAFEPQAIIVSQHPWSMQQPLYQQQQPWR
jgi:hypothetical protein